MNSMKCDISSTSSKSCTINNKITSVSFGGKKVQKLLSQGTRFFFFPNEADTPKFAAIFLFSDTKSDYLGEKKKVGAIR